MAWTWSWFALANVLASTLLFVLGLLFLRARRSAFAVAFAVYCMLAAGQKLAGGVALYVAPDEATRRAWLLGANVCLVLSTATLVHALAAFTWRRPRTRAATVALYAATLPLLAVLLAGAVPLEIFGLAAAGLFVAILAVFLVPVGRRALSPHASVARSQARYVAAYLAIALLFSVEARVILFRYGVMPWWEISLAYMAATGILLYGILKTHLFDIDVKLKIAIRQSTLAALFIAVFFVVSEIAASALSDQIGSVLGIVAAGLLLFALAPLQRVAERFADKAMPHVRASPEYLSYRKLQVYRGAVESALRDGVVTSDERSMLLALRRDLGIGEADAEAVEREVAGA